MKILQVHNSYEQVGGEDVVVDQEYVLLKKHGHQVSQYIVSNAALNSFSKKLNTAVSMPYNKKQKKLFRYRLLKDNPDVVHIHNMFPILSPAVIDAAHELNIPVVVTLHNYRLLCINGLLFKNGKACEACINKVMAWPGILSKCYQNSAAISYFPAVTNAHHHKLKTWQTKVAKFVFLTPFAKEVFDRSRIKLPPHKIAIKPNFVVDRGYSVKKDDYFVFVGRLSAEKGIKEVVLGAIAARVQLKIAGTGPLQDWVLQQSSKHKNIVVLGFQNREQLNALYKNALALIFGSKLYEGLPMVIIEAYSMGTPVIAPNYGNAGVIVTEKTGELYQEFTPQAIQGAIISFKTKNQTELSKNARHCFESHYTPAQNIKLLEGIYNSILA